MKNRWNSYEDYAHEIDEDAERKAHEAGECQDWCPYCKDERDLDDMVEHVNKELEKDAEREEADKHGYYDSKQPLEERMKTIDLRQADDALRALMTEFGLQDQSRCINLEFWNRDNGEKEININLTAFLKEGHCKCASEPTWQDAIESLRINLQQHFNKEPKIDGEIEVIVPEVVN